MTKRNIKPAREGLVVRMAGSGKVLPADGDTVTWSPYWQRRLDDGSVVEVKDETQAVPNEALEEQPTEGEEQPDEDVLLDEDAQPEVTQ